MLPAPRAFRMGAEIMRHLVGRGLTPRPLRPNSIVPKYRVKEFLMVISWDQPPPLTDKQRDAILLVLLKHIRPKLKPSDLNAIRFPDGTARATLDRLLSEQFAEQELKKKRDDQT